jgi:hypothetical protein
MYYLTMRTRAPDKETYNMHASTQSASERAALAFYATLPFPVAPAQTFAPHLPIRYRDGAGIELEGRPDALCSQQRSYTFIESKNGVLNHHLDKASSHRALQAEYTRRAHDGRDKPYNELTDYFHRHDPGFLQDHAWNASLFKVLALQAEHGWQRYIVCFKNNPTKRDAERYLSAGLVFCTEKTLPRMLQTIELTQHGIFVPFVFREARAYSFSVTPNLSDKGRTVAEVAASDRAKFDIVVAASKAAAEDPDPF